METGNSPSKKLKIQDSSANNLPEPQKLEEDQKDELVSESTKNLMEEKVQRALVKEEERRQEEKRLEEENKNNPHDVSDEEELNSDDDVSEYNEDINPGRNILLAYYKKCKRKKDRRKIVFKHCILRIDEEEYIIPNAKGDFDWIGNSRNRGFY